MQYPLRPCWRPYELDERCKEVNIFTFLGFIADFFLLFCEGKGEILNGDFRFFLG